MISPGDSVQPAKRPPTITACDSVRAFTISPEPVIQPSAIIETQFWRAICDATYRAVICGMPTPATIRVVQIAPGH